MSKVEELERRVADLRKQVKALQQKIQDYEFEDPDFRTLIDDQYEFDVVRGWMSEEEEEDDDDDLKASADYPTYRQASRDVRSLALLLKQLEVAEEDLEGAEYEKYGNTDDDPGWYEVREQDRQPLDLAARVLRPDVMAEFRRLLEGVREWGVLDRWARNHPEKLMRLSVKDFRYLLIRVIDQARREFEAQDKVQEMRKNGISEHEALEMLGIDMRL